MSVAESALKQRTEGVLQHALHRVCGLELLHQEPGKAWCRFEVTAALASPAGALHSSALYGLLDATCYLAVLPMLQDEEDAVTVDLHASVIRAAPLGARVALRAEVLRRGRTIAFVRCDAQTADGGTGTIASAAVTHSIRLIKGNP